jgi:hypothetical protein
VTLRPDVRGPTIARDVSAPKAQEKVVPFEPGVAYPSCVSAKLQGSPEGCGSIPGYCNPLEAILDPGQPEYEGLLEWLGGDCDPEADSVGDVNRRFAPIQGWWAKSSR